MKIYLAMKCCAEEYYLFVKYHTLKTNILRKYKI